MLLGYTHESLKGQTIMSVLKPVGFRLPHDASCQDFLGEPACGPLVMLPASKRVGKVAGR